MGRIATAMTAAVLLVFGVSACGGTGDSGSSDSGGAPVAKGSKLEPADITLWVGFTQRELGVIKDTVKEFEKANPQVKVKVVGGINDDKIIAASRGGKAPDVTQSFSADNSGAFCGSGALDRPQALHGPRRDRRQHLPARAALATRSSRAPAARCRCSPTPTASTTTRTCSRRRVSTGRRRPSPSSPSTPRSSPCAIPTAR